MAILNLSTPVIFFIYFFLTRRRLNKQAFRVINFILIGLMFLISVPIHFSNYEYSNWILRFLTQPILLTAFALLLAQLFIRFKKLAWVFFTISFLLNGVQQSVIFFGSAMGDGNYPSRYNPTNSDWNYDTLVVDTWVQHGFAGPPFRNFDISRLRYNGLVYKQIAKSINPDTINCVVNIRGHSPSENYELNLCQRTLVLPNGITLKE